MTPSGLLKRNTTAERTVVRILQALLALLLVSSFYRQDIRLIISASIALAVSITPVLLRHRYDIPLDSGIVLWITTAISLHVLGLLWFYGNGGWYDQFAHMISAITISGIGYAGLYAIELHTEEIEIPRKYTAFFLIVTILGFGVLWEILEYTLGGFTVYGVSDTALDLVFNAIGAAIVAVFDPPQLRRLARDIANRYES